MRKRSSVACVLVILLNVVLVVPPDVAAQAAQRAGQVSAVVPSVNLIRGTQQMAAGPRMAVDWGDVINTGKLARARLSLDDGSILNVGAESNLQVVKHDAGAQQTELELNYGRVRVQAVHLTKPGAKFETRTPTGVAGVVGTAFFLIYENFITHLVVTEGAARFCNLAGVCVVVNAGMMSTIRGPNQAPDQPVTVPAGEATEANASTTTTGVQGAQAAQGAASGGMMATHGLLMTATMVAAVAVPIAVVRAVSTTSTCGSHNVVVAVAPKTGTTAARGQAASGGCSK